MSPKNLRDTAFLHKLRDYIKMLLCILTNSARGLYNKLVGIVEDSDNVPSLTIMGILSDMF